MTTEYSWTERYRDALVETDDNRVPNRLQAAKVAIGDRLNEMQSDHGGSREERRAISDALAELNLLRRELEEHSQDKGGNA
jgi:hypothetical protein